MKDGGPAFPTTTMDRDGDKHVFQGMTLRDYFAAKLAAAIQMSEPERSWANTAKAAYAGADAMLAAREGGAS